MEVESGRCAGSNFRPPAIFGRSPPHSSRVQEHRPVPSGCKVDRREADRACREQRDLRAATNLIGWSRGTPRRPAARMVFAWRNCIHTSTS